MKIQNKGKPHVNVGRIGHVSVARLGFEATIRDLMMQSKPGDVILICPANMPDDQLQKIIREHVFDSSPVSILTPLQEIVVSAEAEVQRVLDSFLKPPAPVPPYQGTPWPPLKKRMPYEFHPGHKHRVGIHLIRSHRKLMH